MSTDPIEDAIQEEVGEEHAAWVAALVETWGITCATCSTPEHLKITATVECAIQSCEGILPETPEDNEPRWDDDSPCFCTECSAAGTVADFRIGRTSVAKPNVVTLESRIALHSGHNGEPTGDPEWLGRICDFLDDNKDAFDWPRLRLMLANLKVSGVHFLGGGALPEFTVRLCNMD